MSDSILSDIAGLFLIVFLIIVGPVYQAFETNDRLVDSMANNSIESFQKNVRKNGYVDMDSYNDFLNDLSKTGRVYKVALTHTSRLVYPSPDKINDYEIHEVKYGTENILRTIKDGSKYTMRYGDDFKLLIKENEVAPSRLLMGIISNKEGNLLTITSGGMVENEVIE